MRQDGGRGRGRGGVGDGDERWMLGMGILLPRIPDK